MLPSFSHGDVAQASRRVVGAGGRTGATRPTASHLPAPEVFLERPPLCGYMGRHDERRVQARGDEQCGT